MKTKNGEIDMTISNSLLNKFIASNCNINKMDEQDVEEMLIRCDNLHVTYTSDIHITALQEVYCPPLNNCTQSSTVKRPQVLHTKPSAIQHAHLPKASHLNNRKVTPGPVFPTPPKKPRKGETALSSTAPSTAEDMELDDTAHLFNHWFFFTCYLYSFYKKNVYTTRN